LIDPFLTVQQNGTESGFSTDLSDNNNLPLDDKRDNLSKFTNTFTLGDVSIVDGYYIFYLDVNEPGSSPESLISLDYLKIYDTKSSSLVTLGQPMTLADLDSQGWDTKYSLDASTDNSVLLDYNFFAGSGKGFDMELKIPVSVFAGTDPTSRIVFAGEFGLSGSTIDGASTADGFEEWWFRTGSTEGCPPGTTGTPPNCDFTYQAPAPPTVILLALGLAAVALSSAAQVVLNRRSNRTGAFSNITLAHCACPSCELPRDCSWPSRS